MGATFPPYFGCWDMSPHAPGKWLEIGHFSGMQVSWVKKRSLFCSLLVRILRQRWGVLGSYPAFSPGYALDIKWYFINTHNDFMNRNPSFSGMILFFQLNRAKGGKGEKQYKSDEAKRKIQSHFYAIYVEDSRSMLLWVGRRGFQRYISLGVNGLRHTAELHTQLSPTAA